MSCSNDPLILEADLNRVRAMLQPTIGRRLAFVRYRTPLGWGWPYGLETSDAIHQIADRIIVGLDDGSAIVIGWEMERLSAGITLCVEATPTLPPDKDETDVGHGPAWQPLLGRSVDGLAVGLQENDRREPETVWSLRLELSGPRLVVVALGCVERGKLKYQPDYLVAIFDELISRGYMGTGGRVVGVAMRT